MKLSLLLVIAFAAASTYAFKARDDHVHKLLHGKKYYVEVAEKEDWKNVALNKPAKQSSTYEEYGVKAEAKYANDGDQNQEFSPNSNKMCAHTDDNKNAYWEVDLEDFYEIKEVKIYSRSDCCGDALTPLKVQINDGQKDWSDCASVTTPGSDGKIWTISCTGDKVRNLRVIQDQTDSNYLMLCEVEVLGKKWVAITTTTTTKAPATAGPINGRVVSKDKSSYQSSDYDFYGTKTTAKYANDGKTDQDFNLAEGRVCSGTDLEKHAWWKVDLGSVETLTSVRIYSRSDCCGDYLTPLRVETSLDDKDYTVCGTVNQKGNDGEIYDVPCKVNKAKWVRIQQWKDDEDYLMLCEVQVIAPLAPPTPAPTGPPCTASTKADIIFVLDGSGSITAPVFNNNFLPAVTGVINYLLPGDGSKETASRIACVTYDQKVRPQFNFGEVKTKDDVVKRVKAIKYFPYLTNTGLAFNYVRTTIVPKVRSGLKPIIILITDGQSTDDVYNVVDEAEKLKKDGAVIFAVGVSKLVDKAQLNKIASSSTYRRDVSNYADLQAKITELATVACQIAVSTP